MVDPVLKTINVEFTDEEHEGLIVAKAHLNWHDFILTLLDGRNIVARCPYCGHQSRHRVIKDGEVIYLCYNPICPVINFEIEEEEK